jgi:hypothetical protein
MQPHTDSHVDKRGICGTSVVFYCHFINTHTHTHTQYCTLLIASREMHLKRSGGLC